MARGIGCLGHTFQGIGRLNDLFYGDARLGELEQARRVFEVQVPALFVVRDGGWVILVAEFDLAQRKVRNRVRGRQLEQLREMRLGIRALAESHLVDGQILQGGAEPRICVQGLPEILIRLIAPVLRRESHAH
ncbi:MAG: hypothetical protein DMG59_06085 [Acidobacteria bacterium]|nr:MAG: hypothetical protein DMG59_06085 [Acidobacteriota bacterium]